MPINQITVKHEVGLHARPASKFVEMASSFDCDISVRNLTNGAGPANAKSMISILTLGVTQGHDIEIETSGAEADAALSSLMDLVRNNFGD